MTTSADILAVAHDAHSILARGKIPRRAPRPLGQTLHLWRRAANVHQTMEGQAGDVQITLSDWDGLRLASVYLSTARVLNRRLSTNISDPEHIEGWRDQHITFSSIYDGLEL